MPRSETNGSPASRAPARAAVEALEDRRLMSVGIALAAGKNELLAFDTDAPSVALGKAIKVKGLARRESLLGIDFRPANGQLYALGSSNRLYTIALPTGQATAVGDPAATFSVPLTGNSFGFDFNPVPDRIRVVSDTGQNLRLHPDTGAVVDADAAAAGVQVDGNLAYAAGDPGAGVAPAVTAVAYTNNVAGTPDTSLYGIDTARDALVLQGSAGGAPVSPNTGQLTTVGPLGVDVQSVAGFDVETVGGANSTFAAVNTDPRGRARSQLARIDLGTGAATNLGDIGKSRRPVRDIAIAPRGRTAFVATTKNEIARVDTNLPFLTLAKARVTGLASRREKIVGIDVRPATGQLFALTTADRLYSVNPATGVASQVGADPSAVALNDKAAFGVDFNPVPDRLRVVNETGQNLRLNPDTGAAVDFDAAAEGVQPDTALAYVAGDANAGATPHVAGAAYTNNAPGAVNTTLYAIDSDLDILVTQGSPAGAATSPNTGQLFSVGPLGVDAAENLGFDVVTVATGSPEGTNAAFAAFGRGRSSKATLYSIDLTSGAATALGNLDPSLKVVGLTFALPAS